MTPLDRTKVIAEPEGRPPSAPGDSCRFAAGFGECLGDGTGVGLELLGRNCGEHVVPGGDHRAAELHHSDGAGEEPEVEVLAAVAPPVEVGAADAVDPADRLGDALDQYAESGGEFGRQVVEAIVLARFESRDHRQTTGPEGFELPLVVTPDDEPVRISTLRTRLSTRLTVARRFRQHRLVQRHHLHIPVEGKERSTEQRLSRDTLTVRKPAVVLRRQLTHAPHSAEPPPVRQCISWTSLSWL